MSWGAPYISWITVSGDGTTRVAFWQASGDSDAKQIEACTFQDAQRLKVTRPQESSFTDWWSQDEPCGRQACWRGRSELPRSQVRRTPSRWKHQASTALLPHLVGERTAEKPAHSHPYLSAHWEFRHNLTIHLTSHCRKRDPSTQGGAILMWAELPTRMPESSDAGPCALPEAAHPFPRCAYQRYFSGTIFYVGQELTTVWRALL